MVDFKTWPLNCNLSREVWICRRSSSNTSWSSRVWPSDACLLPWHLELSLLSLLVWNGHADTCWTHMCTNTFPSPIWATFPVNDPAPSSICNFNFDGRGDLRAWRSSGSEFWETGTMVYCQTGKNDTNEALMISKNHTLPLPGDMSTGSRTDLWNTPLDILKLEGLLLAFSYQRFHFLKQVWKTSYFTEFFPFSQDWANPEDN